ncbi:MAG: MBL fold metallo-hydrolase [Bacteroidota bacterium]|nr:MBL fold metallo-hydrolase [Bacteroidota bacterium]
MFIAIIILIIAYLAVYLRFAPVAGSDPTKEEVNRFSVHENFRLGKFQNAVPTRLSVPLSALVPLLKFNLLSRDKAPSEPIEVPPFDLAKWVSIRHDQLGLIWFGHSSLMLKVNGKTILIDPVFSKRASMFRLIGPHRFPMTDPVRPEDLPDIDILLITHDHYDHLDYFALKKMRSKVGEVVTTLGVRSHFRRWGWDMERLRECGWGDEIMIDEIRMVCCPARHFSGRRIDNRMSTLWSSWVIQGGNMNLYHGADSGYHPGFQQIGEKYGPFDLATLECGAYSPYWPEIHMLPEETIQAGVDLNAKVVMPIHWGKFALGPHPWNEPPQRAEAKAKELGIPLFIPRIQEVNEFQGPYISDWWR